jgi:ABC-type sugar transport system permease subunit
MYLGILIGVIFSSVVQQAQKGKTFHLNVTTSMVLTSAVIALLVMPYVFKQSIDPASPFLVRFGLFVQNGVFWQVAVGVAGKVASVSSSA